MRAIIAIFLFSTSVSFAGDGGFSNYTCVSSSGRTVLNFFVDHFSESKIPNTVRLTIDGQQVEYKPELDADGEVVGCEDECDDIKFDYRTKELTVNQGEAFPLKAVIDGNRSMLKKGFFDPRTNTVFASAVTGDISLTCKHFYLAP